ncbi:amidohydrolase family protein [Phyllobacterium chamaecytisi]|uniref:amidohydrolase family protein n=1 Tax=Phyllobacterium chamaecytisi TaxID=2876082 RepID=UPI001CCACB2F|nr:amidohydrolase family protein [Phyllobacterium sp. KW56]MBZ9603302.1 amidohydrolase family protein [Phyllobacterium sp. KW56]
MSDEQTRDWPQDMPIVDPHHHLWDLENNRYPWLQQEPPPQLVCGDIRPIRHSYLVGDLRADFGSLPVTKTVHLQCDWDPTDPIGETRWLNRQAYEHGLPTGIVAYAKLQDHHVAAILDGHLAASGRVRGVRQIMNWHADSMLTFGAPKGLMRTPEWRRGFAMLAPRGLSFDLQLYSHQMDEADKLAGDFSGTSIVLNHGGMPVDRSPEGFALWRKGMRALARHDNITVKISGLGMVDHHWTVDSLRPVVEEIIAIFGSSRAMFASNFPVDKLYSSYAAVWQAFHTITAAFSADERRALFAANAERIYRIKD